MVAPSLRKVEVDNILPPSLATQPTTGDFKIEVHYASQRELISTGTFCPSADIAVDVLSKGKNQ